MRIPILVISLVCGVVGFTSAAPNPTTKHAARAKPKPKAKSGKSKQTWRHDFSRYQSPPDVTSTPAYRYGTMTATECEAELAARNVPFVKESATRGVLAPVRLTGPMHGVEYRTNLKAAARATTPYEIADCRLVLALDDFAVILEAHGVVDVRHYSIYRSPGASWPEHKRGLRHNGGLAIDAARFILQDGSFLDVDQHFNGAIGAKTCGEGSGPHPVTAKATELRAILCEAVAQRIFNFHLTPNYNRPHKNHFHLEVTAGFRSFLAH